MIFGIDHVVFAATPAQCAEIAASLEQRGFVREAFSLDFGDSGVGSESWSFASGAFLELVSEHTPGSGPAVWFGETPRVIGIGFASDAFEQDIAWDSPDPGAWAMDEQHAMRDGSTLRIHAAGPHRHLSDLYAFVMDRPEGRLEFPARPQTPVLDTITLAGAARQAWATRLARWLRAPATADGALEVGGVRLAFAPGASPNARASLSFTGASAETIPLVGGAIEIAARDEAA
ncbi:MAG TPA: hypothetical protein VGM91_03190 [Conexibacter sp.]|jgi:hypothetical protein